jgi:hypothetical protein
MIKINGHPIGSGVVPRIERRSERRRRSLLTGLLKFNRDFCVLECVVRDVSSGGARLRFGGDTIPVPTQFDVMVGEGGDWQPAEIRWRGATEVGIALRR